MDMRNGQIHPSAEAATEAGVPEEYQRPVFDYYPGPNKCGTCGKTFKVRKSTPQKYDGNGLLWRWCNKCWYRRGVAHE